MAQMPNGLSESPARIRLLTTSHARIVQTLTIMSPQTMSVGICRRNQVAPIAQYAYSSQSKP